MQDKQEDQQHEQHEQEDENQAGVNTNLTMFV